MSDQSRSPIFSKTFWEKIAIYSICIVDLAYVIPSVTIAEMVLAFPGASRETIMMCISIPCLTALLGINLIPALQSRFSLKKISMAALLMSLCCGTVSLLCHNNLTVLLVLSGVQGIPYGVFCTIYPLLTAAAFPEGPERAKTIANCIAMVQIGRLVLLYFGGLLADIAWYLMYLMFALNGVAFLLILFFLPDRGITPRRTKGSTGCYVQLLKSPSFLYFGITAGLFLMFYYVFSTHGSLYIQGYNLGDPSTTGTSNAIASILSVCTALLSTRVFRITKRYTTALAFLGMGLGLLMPGTTKAVWAFMVSMTIASVVKSQQMPAVARTLAQFDDERMRASAMALKETFVNICYFSSGTITSALSRWFGDGSPQNVFLICAICTIVIGVCMLCVEAYREKKGLPVLSV